MVRFSHPAQLAPRASTFAAAPLHSLFAEATKISFPGPYTRYLRGPLSKKGLYFGFPYPDFRTRAQKLGTRRVPRATSFSEKRTPGSGNRTLPMAASCSRSAGLVAD